MFRANGLVNINLINSVNRDFFVFYCLFAYSFLFFVCSFCLFDRVSLCSLCCSRTLFLDQTGLNLTEILLVLPPQFWD